VGLFYYLSGLIKIPSFSLISFASNQEQDIQENLPPQEPIQTVTVSVVTG